MLRPMASDPAGETGSNPDTALTEPTDKVDGDELPDKTGGVDELPCLTGTLVGSELDLQLLPVNESSQLVEVSVVPDPTLVEKPLEEGRIGVSARKGRMRAEPLPGEKRAFEVNTEDARAAVRAGRDFL